MMRSVLRVMMTTIAITSFSVVSWSDDREVCLYGSDPKSSISSCSKAIEELSKSSSTSSGDELAAAYGRRAEGYLLLEKFPDATSDIKKALEIQPDISSSVGNRSLYLRAVASHLQGHADDAIVDCNALLNLSPNAEIYWLRANAYAQKGDEVRSKMDLAEARSFARPSPNAIEGDPKEGELLAAKLCSSCHDTGALSKKTKKKFKAPSFVAIASRPSQSDDDIVAAMLYPHPGMPRLQYDNFFAFMQLRAIAAYVMSKKPSPE